MFWDAFSVNLAVVKDPFSMVYLEISVMLFNEVIACLKPISISQASYNVGESWKLQIYFWLDEKLEHICQFIKLGKLAVFEKAEL